MSEAVRVRSLFLSDVHLGAAGCQADRLVEFLRIYDADTIYLVGDIIDGWKLKKNWRWPQAHNDVIQKLLRKVRKGARLVYLPGNHDEFLRDYIGHSFGGIEILDDVVHEAADGRRYLVIHGDRFDAVVTNHRWLALLGDWAYELAIRLSLGFSHIRRRLGLPYWSFSSWAKVKVKKAVNFISDFEHCLAEEAKRQGADGVICGHIHHAAMRSIGPVAYVNTGDWVESCTAVAEHEDGRLELIYYIDRWENKPAPVLEPENAVPAAVPSERSLVETSKQAA